MITQDFSQILVHPQKVAEKFKCFDSQMANVLKQWDAKRMGIFSIKRILIIKFA